MKKISKLLSYFFAVGGITATIAFVNAQNMPDRAAASYMGRTKDRVCVQVVAPAISPEGICKDFPTPCDIPEGWKKVSQCSGSDTALPAPPSYELPADSPKIKPIIPIIGDNIETDLRQELSIRETRGWIICKELDRCPLSEAKNSPEVSIKSAKITEIGTDYLKISVFGYIYRANISSAKIVRASETILSIKELSIGDIVNVTGFLDIGDNYLINAATIRNVSIARKQDIFTGVAGNIILPDAFILKTNTDTGTGKSLTVVVGADTQIIKTGMPYSCKSSLCPLMMRPDLVETKGSFSDLKTGMQVMVRGIFNKTALKVEARLIILKGYAATEVNGGQTREGTVKPETGVIDPKAKENRIETKGIGISNESLSAPLATQAPKAGFWDRIMNWFGR